MGKPASSDFERLMADPRLAELNELQRGASDALDLIELSENQNSDILAWLFESQEGHGQGDEILRDLLLFASKRAMESECLAPQSMTQRFFERWTPSRIRTTSFGGAFPVREFGLNQENRSDLAVIDEQNQLVVVIENKTKTKHTDSQLNRYRKDFENAIENNKRLSKFVVAFIAMSEAFDYDEGAKRPCSDTWLHVGYGWLKASADRAVRQVERGNASAQLVASYCTLRTQWEDPLDRERTLKAAGLIRDYPEAITELRKFVGPKMTARWFQHEEKTSGAMLFVLQNRATALLLAQLGGPEALAAQVEALLGLQPDDSVEWRKSGVSVRAPNVEHLSIDDWWVSYFNIEQSKMPDRNAGVVRYDFALVLKPEKFRSPIEAERIRARYKDIDKRFAGSSSRNCTAVLAKGLAEGEALSLLQQHYRRLSAG
jgi:hypothetical protein